MSDGPFLSRWSRLKRESRAAAAEPPQAPAVAPAPLPAAEARAGAPAEAATAEGEHPLPPLESLTPESDFTGFMKPEVDADTRRQALKALFADPKFNVMDGLDVYIDDYSKSDPLPVGWLEKMNQVARLGDFRPAEEAMPVDAASDTPAELPAVAENVADSDVSGGDGEQGAMLPESCRFDTKDEVSTALPLKESGS